MAGSDETMRLVAELLDKTSGPLKEIQKNMQAAHNVAMNMHSRQTGSLREQVKQWGEMQKGIKEATTTIIGGITPAFAALGISVFGVSEAIGQMTSSLTDAGKKYNVLVDASKRSGLPTKDILGFAYGLERLGVAQDAAIAGAAAFGDHMERLRHQDPQEINLWTSTLTGAYQSLGIQLSQTKDNAEALQVAIEWFNKNPWVPPWQRSLIMGKLLGLPPEIANQYADDVRDAMIRGQRTAEEHPPITDALRKKIHDAIADWDEALTGFANDFQTKIGPSFAETVAKMAKAIEDNKGAIKGFFDDMAATLKSDSQDLAAIVRAIEWITAHTGEGSAFYKFWNSGGALHDWWKGKTEGGPANPFVTPKATPNSRVDRSFDNLYHPSSFGGAAEGGGSALDFLTRGVKAGTLEALQEFYASVTGQRVGGGGSGGVTPANYTPEGSGVGGNSGNSGRNWGSAAYPNIGGDSNAGENPMGGRGPVSLGSSDVNTAIERASKAYALDPAMMKGMASIESAMTPGSNRNRATQYKGLFQIGRNEWARTGQGGDIYNAEDNAMAAGRLMQDNITAFKRHFGRDPTHTEIYMMHQQGLGFYTRGAMTNIAGNPYPGMRGPQTHDSFEQGWGRELERRERRFRGKSSGDGNAPNWLTPNGLDLLDAGRRSGFGNNKVTGDASLSIDLNGFPKGTRTTQNASGLFSSVTLNRGRQMPEASETE